MPTVVEELPTVPARATQNPGDFVISTDAFLRAIRDRIPQMNLQASETNLTAGLVLASVGDANAAVARAEAAAAYRVSIGYKTWTELAAVDGSEDGQLAATFDHAGNHTDPVVGGSVPNQGIFRWSEAEQAWEFLRENASANVDWGDITDKPATFTPSVHGHDIADITGLSAALDAKAVAGAVASSGITADANRLVGRIGTSGALQAIALGAGLGFVEGALAYTGGSSMVYAGAGIVVSSGSAWGTSLAIPSGDLVGTTAAQPISNKTFGNGNTYTAGTDSGITKTGGEIRASVVISDTGTIAGNSPGLRGMPNVNVTNRTIVATDMGKVVEFTGTATFPAGLPAGFSCTLDNGGNSTASIARSGGQVLRKGNATPTSLTLAARGTAACWKNAAGEIKFAGDVS